jgi:hypothetical protein
MRWLRVNPVERDARREHEQTESAFSVILSSLVERAVGSRGAALVDVDGETVDYAGRGADSFPIRVAAAHWRIVLAEMGSGAIVDCPTSFAVRTTRVGFVVHALPDGYALVLLFARSERPERYARALSVCTHWLAREAGWNEFSVPRWYPAEVAQDGRGIPTTIVAETGPMGLDVIGRYRARHAWRERAWRVRSQAGIEGTLVREVGGFWYADEDLTKLNPKIDPEIDKATAKTG